MEFGKISSRGQVAIPQDIRRQMGLSDGEKIVFFLDGSNLLIKKASELSWAQITRPLRSSTKNIKEAKVNQLIHKMRKNARSTGH
ncbi:AbrB/MazE/SpoVT family DNA-binding domain-containing protein [Candidatus Micrarchaeota archaeon]|nr:AbrB/MazE/SpoVT family DNA-binding domain-containing protein [Candidatus Micrarchaeota archaeon]